MKIREYLITHFHSTVWLHDALISVWRGIRLGAATSKDMIGAEEKSPFWLALFAAYRYAVSIGAYLGGLVGAVVFYAVFLFLGWVVLMAVVATMGAGLHRAGLF
ncbi:MAG: hypothetical protein PHU46_15015 [Rhodocyclaceae bacterium]|nr:hypothetical protein [Rhodocyclaceae bacterium]